MSKSYELFLHYKQGDDFHGMLEQHAGDIPKALRAWAEWFKENAATCERLAKAFEGQTLEANADTHLIQFVPGDDAATQCLETMAVEELLSVVEFDDEDAEDEDDEDDD